MDVNCFDSFSLPFSRFHSISIIPPVQRIDGLHLMEQMKIVIKQFLSKNSNKCFFLTLLWRWTILKATAYVICEWRADTLQIFSSNLLIYQQSQFKGVTILRMVWERDNGLMCIIYHGRMQKNWANWHLTKSDEVVKLNTETERQGIRIKIKEKLNSGNRKQVLSVNMCLSLDFRLNLHNDIKCCYLKTYNRVCFHNVHISRWIMNLNYKCSTIAIKTSNWLF